MANSFKLSDESVQISSDRAVKFFHECTFFWPYFRQFLAVFCSQQYSKLLGDFGGYGDKLVNNFLTELSPGS